MYIDYVTAVHDKYMYRYKAESTRNLTNKWTKPLYQDCLHHIANFGITALNIFSKKLFLTAQNVENKF